MDPSPGSKRSRFCTFVLLCTCTLFMMIAPLVFSEKDLGSLYETRDNLLEKLHDIQAQIYSLEIPSKDKHVELLTGETYHPVVEMKSNYIVRDFTQGLPSFSGLFMARRAVGQKFPMLGAPQDIGRYNEYRKAMYDRLVDGVPNSEGFTGARCIHIGIDIGDAIGTPVMNFMDGKIHSFGYNPSDGDYGHVIVTEHQLKGRKIWALYGHLSASSMHKKFKGQAVKGGEVLAYMGGVKENGGWPPHLHFQLSFLEPTTHDMPGVVSFDDHARALDQFPDPRLVLGQLYAGEGLFQ